MGRRAGKEKIGRAVKGKVPREGKRAERKARGSDSSEPANVFEIYTASGRISVPLDEIRKDLLHLKANAKTVKEVLNG
jgi:hypothetical protein